MDSSFFPFFHFLPLSLFLLIASGFGSPDWYESCNTNFVCGKINTSYPFWGNNRVYGCGVPGLELKCQNQTTLIQINNLEYRVLEIDEYAQILRIAREDYANGICQPEFVNTTLDPDLFQYASGYRNITVFYGCPVDGHGAPPLFSCKISGSAFESGFARWEANSLGLFCYNSVYVPVSIVDWATAVSISSSLEEGLKQGFAVKWRVDDTACDDCIRSKGACGYDVVSNQTSCYCPGSKTCAPSSSDSVPDISFSYGPEGKSNRILLIIGVATAGAIIIFAYFFTRKRGIWSGKTMKQEEKVEAFITDYHSLMPKRYSYSDIKKMTNSFINKLGQGGFAGVYQGKLSDGRPVAVKLLIKSIGDGEEFINEVASISRTSHVNVVTLLGFCYERTKRALVYEYMPNGSLDKFLCHEGSHDEEVCHLEQKTLFEIAIGIARGLEYLHRGCNTRIVHFDIKPHNILLDEDFCPKISDFGLAKLCKGKESILSMLGARGTAGYIAPEVFMRGYGGVSYKSDVYSYGMMILEMFAGKQIVDTGEIQTSSDKYFPDFIYKNLERGHTSAHDVNMTGADEEIGRKMTIVGLWCIQTNPTNRPSMTKVIEMLEGSTEFSQIPPKPLLSSPTNPTEIFSSSLSSICMQSETDEDKILPLP